MTNLEKIKLGGAAALTASIATIVHGVNVAFYYSAGAILAGVVVAVVAAGAVVASWKYRKRVALEGASLVQFLSVSWVAVFSRSPAWVVVALGLATALVFIRRSGP